MSRRTRIALATALAVGATFIGAVSSGTVQAGVEEPGSVEVHVSVLGADAANVLDGLTTELWELPDAVNDVWDSKCVPIILVPLSSPESAGSSSNCINLPVGDYGIGIEGLPDGARVEVFCNPVRQGNEFELITVNADEINISGDFPDWSCTVRVTVPTLRVDKIVEGGTASPSDFTIQVYDDGGLVATATDTSDGVCSIETSSEDCAIVGLPEGDFQLGEVAVLGYLPTNVGCTLGFAGPDERFPAGVGEFTLSGVFEQFYPLVYCEITNTYFEGDIVVDKVVINDDGGTAAEDDFTAEVYLESDGSLATSGQCTVDGSCIDEALPIGEYRVGESGPSGYTASVECAVIVEPDPPGIGTEPPVNTAPPEAITGDAALFELEPFGEVTCVITNNDDPQPTTTTTTLATTTTASGQSPILPATGGDSDSLGLIAALGAAMLLMGGTLLAARRRS